MALIANALVIHLNFDNRRHIPFLMRKIFLNGIALACCKCRKVKSKSSLKSNGREANETKVLSNNHVVINIEMNDGRCSKLSVSPPSDPQQFAKDEASSNLGGSDEQLVSDWDRICKILD